MAIDRLRFRAYYEMEFLDDDDNEYSKKFHLEEISVSRYDDAGIFVDDLIRQLKEQGFTEKEIDTVLDNFNCDDDWFTFSPWYLAQCTGITDKYGRLIFDGDILKDKNGGICFVVWVDMGWQVQSPGSEAIDREYHDFYEKSEIVGNTFENPKLLEPEDDEI